MKRIVVLFLTLALLLTACGAPTPIVITVIATDEPAAATDVPPATDAPEPTDEPEATEAPEPTDEPEPTDVPEPTEEPEPTEDAEPTEAPVADATNTKPPAVGGDVFSELTRDIDAFSLRCSPSELNFTAVAINPAIVKVVLFYRVVDKNSSVAAGAMVNSKDMTGEKGNFSLKFSALDVKDDLRKDNGWFDYQFVGLNKSGNVVGRSDKIVQQVTFTLDCP